MAQGETGWRVPETARKPGLAPVRWSPAVLLLLSSCISSPGALGAASPTEIPGLQLWLDASRGVSGSPITGWADQSGNRRDFGAWDILRPSAGNGINGHPTVDFDGVGNVMVTGSFTLADLVQTSGWTVFAVFRYQGSSLGEPNVWLQPPVIADNGGFWGMHVTALRFSGFGWDGRETTASLDTAAGASSYGYVRFDGSRLRVGLNGSATAEVPCGALTEKALPYWVEVGRGFPSATFFKGSIGDIAVWNRSLPSEELERVELYFAAKYGL